MSEELGDWSIDPKLVEYIEDVLPKGSTILELGSGHGTQVLADLGYKMHSVEHELDFVGKYDSTYIYAPLEDMKPVRHHPKATSWYNRDKLTEGLKGLKYDLLLIDGPPAHRAGFIKYFTLFDPESIMVFDDLQRDRERRICHSIAGRLDTCYVTYAAGTKKPFGVINDPNQKR